MNKIFRFALAMLLAAIFSFSISCPSAMAQSSGDEQAESKSKLNDELLSGLKLRSIGPALMSGRVADIAVDQQQPNIWYVAVGSGNLWKTENAGITWQPIFENYPSYSIGCVTIDPNDHNTIWVGTGENVGGRHAGFGDGVYVSHDAGKSFENMGLKESEHLSKIVVDPRDSSTIFVASQGPLWSSGGQRGLYKSTDGGKNWRNVLSKGKYTGVTDVVMDPENPDVLYAATHQRHRTVWALLNAGPETGIHKSTDGGETWSELKNGLPTEDKGKIGLQVSPQHSNVVYATIELADRQGGFYRSQDSGNSWTKMSDYIGGGTGPHYYQEIYCDPHRFDVVYHANVVLGRTEDGGKTWKPVGNENKHVDNHAVAFHPTDPDFLLVGCDGGLYRSYDFAKTYAFTANLPVTQFYKLDVDNDYPFYHVVGGTQDNNSQYGPARTGNVQGIRNADWIITIGGDGHDCAIDPQDPNIIYCESQQGYLRRYDRKSGESVDIRPRPEAGEDDFRFNWDSPILISPHDHTRLYFGSKLLHRSDNRGDSWSKISPDLSRGQDRYKLKMMDRVWSIDAAYDLLAMSQYGNITSISESPLVEGLLYVGTDDGLIQVSEDGGKTWTRIDKIYGIPEMAFVNDIKADLHDANTVYATLDDHKTGDYKPYVIKSTDRGKTWDSMVGDLPDKQLCWRIIQDHKKKDLFFLATEFGIFVSLNGGENWNKLKGGVPTIPFRDLAIQRRENDLVGASFGRSFYVLDDYSPLREITEEMLTDKDFQLFPVRKAFWYSPSDALGGRRGSQGDAYFVADNPPFGATFTYYVRDELKSLKKQRQEKEAELNKAGKDIPTPDWEALEKEQQEEPPAIYFEIYDNDERVIARVNGETGQGLHRTSWDLRYSGITPGGGGPMVVPGAFKVQAFKKQLEEITKFGDPQSFAVESIVNSTLEPQNPKDVLKFQMDKAKLFDAVRAAASSLESALTEMAEAKNAIKASPNGNSELLKEADALELKLKDARRKLVGESVRSAKFVETVPSIMQRIGGGWQRDGTYGPTQTHRQQFEIAAKQFETDNAEIKRMLESDLKAFQQSLDKAGIPWTQGRAIPNAK